MKKTELLDQEDCLPIIVRRVDNDVVELRSRNYIIVLRWLIWLALLFCLLYSAYGNIRYNLPNNAKIQILPFFLIEKQIKVINKYTDDYLISKYQDHIETVKSLNKDGMPVTLKTFEEYRNLYNYRFHRAWINLFFWALCFLPLLLPNPRGVRFDRKRGLIYTQNWRGKLFVAPVNTIKEDVRFSVSMIVPSNIPFFHPLKYLNSIYTTPNYVDKNTLEGWLIALYQPKRNGKARTMVKHCGVFPPTMASPTESKVLFEAMTQFMQGDDSKLQQITPKYKRHYYWVGRLFHFSPLGTRQLNEKKLNKQLIAYQQHWATWDSDKQASYLKNLEKINIGYQLSFLQGLIAMLMWLAAFLGWIYYIS